MSKSTKRTNGQDGFIYPPGLICFEGILDPEEKDYNTLRFMIVKYLGVDVEKHGLYYNSETGQLSYTFKVKEGKQPKLLAHLLTRFRKEKYIQGVFNKHTPTLTKFILWRKYGKTNFVEIPEEARKHPLAVKYYSSFENKEEEEAEKAPVKRADWLKKACEVKPKGWAGFNLVSDKKETIEQFTSDGILTDEQEADLAAFEEDVEVELEGAEFQFENKMAELGVGNCGECFSPITNTVSYAESAVSFVETEKPKMTPEWESLIKENTVEGRIIALDLFMKTSSFGESGAVMTPEWKALLSSIVDTEGFVSTFALFSNSV